jgi:DNA polymerase-3 subunit gamma/tau
MLTNQAFNALLKTLEEPPDFVKFILATTDPLKLPATILSRTQHFRFKKIPQPLVEKHLEHILNLEKIGFEKEAIEIIARSGAGSLRDSLTLLDQAIVYSQNFVDVATVTGMLGIIEPSLLEKLLADIIRKDTNAILNFISDASDYEAEMILDELTLYLKSLLLEGSGKLTPMIIERFFRIIAESKNLLALGSDGEFVLSLSLFKMVEALQIKDIDTMIRGLEQELKGVEVSEIMVTTPAPDLSVPKEVITITEEEILSPGEKGSVERLVLSAEKEKKEEVSPAAKEEPASLPKTEPQSTEAIPSQQEEPLTAVQTPSKTPTTQEEPTEEEHPPLNTERLTLSANKFKELVSKIYDRDYDLGGCFERNITFVSFEDNLLTWESTAEEDDKKMLIKYWGVINMFVKEIFGFETKIKNIAKKKVLTEESNEEKVGSTEENTISLNAPPIHNDADAGSMIEEVEMKSSCISPDAGETEAAKEKDPSTLLEEPMIKTAMELFSPKKVRITKNG